MASVVSYWRVAIKIWVWCSQFLWDLCWTEWQ